MKTISVFKIFQKISDIIGQDWFTIKTSKIEHMKKQIYLLTCFLCVSGMALAQKGSLKKVNQLFETKAYAQAADIYETKERTQNVLQNLGDSYYYNSAIQKAVKTYRELFLTYGDSLDLEYYFRYAQALKGAKNYKDADKYLSIYYNQRINTPAFIDEIEKITPHTFTLKQIKGNNSKSDFGLTFFGENKVAFASVTNTENSAFAWNNLPYLDLYHATLTSDGTLEDITPFSEEINTDSHESNATFSKDGKTMYFNRTSLRRSKAEKERIAQIKIYKAELINGIWSNVKALPFNSKNYSTEHPTLSNDGETLYFASDRPGGFGGFDIYRVTINDDGTYSEPENLGEKVNTKHREQFPYISNLNTLYFASDGHQGFGGLDVFRSNMVNANFDTPVNLGNTINSNLDDFGYTIRERHNRGFVTSNKSGYDQIYGFDREENILTKYLVEGIVKDKNSKELLIGSLVTLFDENNRVLQDTIVGNDADYLFKIEPNKKYKVRGTRKAYIPQDVEFSTDSKGKISHNIFLVLESYADAEERIKEDERGNIQIELEKIFFDFDKANIRNDAASTLDVLVDLMTKYPSMEVEVSAHTDARGNDQYNLNLSKKRAASTLEYLVQKGINRNRLRSIGYGETQPLNNCDKEGVCSDEKYDINRRCEFKILN